MTCEVVACSERILGRLFFYPRDLMMMRKMANYELGTLAAIWHPQA